MPRPSAAALLLLFLVVALNRVDVVDLVVDLADVDLDVDLVDADLDELAEDEFLTGSPCTRLHSEWIRP